MKVKAYTKEDLERLCAAFQMGLTVLLECMTDDENLQKQVFLNQLAMGKSMVQHFDDRQIKGLVKMSLKVEPMSGEDLDDFLSKHLQHGDG